MTVRFNDWRDEANAGMKAIYHDALNTIGPAYEELRKVDPEAANRLMRKMLDDVADYAAAEVELHLREAIKNGWSRKWGEPTPGPGARD